MSEYWVYKCTEWQRIPRSLWRVDAFHQKIDVCLWRWTLGLAQLAKEEITRTLQSNGAQRWKTQQQLGKAAWVVGILSSAVLFQCDINLLAQWLHMCRHLKTFGICTHNARSLKTSVCTGCRYDWDKKITIEMHDIAWLLSVKFWTPRQSLNIILFPQKISQLFPLNGTYLEGDRDTYAVSIFYGSLQFPSS